MGLLFVQLLLPLLALLPVHLPAVVLPLVLLPVVLPLVVPLPAVVLCVQLVNLVLVHLQDLSLAVTTFLLTVAILLV